MATLYSEVLLDHFRHPRNYGSLPAPDVACEEVNPLCGDRIRVELKLAGGVIEAAHFSGDGCAISIAAASILTELIMGANIDGNDELISSEQILSSLKSDIKPSRRKCAMLALEAFRLGVKNYKQLKLSRE
ncbi:MAG: iron-sulfur cluster assembly scaffold protein [Blastocatellia bacterium]